MLLPTLRADVEMHEAYRAGTGARFIAPLVAVRSSHDELVSAADATEWAAAIKGSFHADNEPGDHMYLEEDPLALVRLLGGLLPRSARR